VDAQAQLPEGVEVAWDGLRLVTQKTAMVTARR